MVRYSGHWRLGERDLSVQGWQAKLDGILNQVQDDRSRFEVLAEVVGEETEALHKLFHPGAAVEDFEFKSFSGAITSVVGDSDLDGVDTSRVVNRTRKGTVDDFFTHRFSIDALFNV